MEVYNWFCVVNHLVKHWSCSGVAGANKVGDYKEAWMTRQDWSFICRARNRKMAATEYNINISQPDQDKSWSGDRYNRPPQDRDPGEGWELIQKWVANKNCFPKKNVKTKEKDLTIEHRIFKFLYLSEYICPTGYLPTIALASLETEKKKTLHIYIWLF